MNKSGQKKSFKSVESVGDKNYIEYYHKMPRILLTGFEPFGRYNLNSSWELVTALPDTIGNFGCIKLCLPVEFNAVSDLIPKLLSEHHPDIILSFGQSTSDAIRIERVAINIDDARIPDNSGYIPTDMPIHADGENAYFATLPIKSMKTAVEQVGVPVVISNSAGTYVCNHTFYNWLYWCDKLRLNTKVGFIHLPRLPEQVAIDEPSMSLDDIKKAILGIIKNL